MDFCIVSAGIGSRFKPFSNFANKALAPLPFKPLIGLIIEAIPPKSKIHIVTGYLGLDLESIISEMYADRELYFYKNDDYLKTGMGDSLIPVLNEVNTPLVILPNDGIYSSKCLFSKYEESVDMVVGVSRTYDFKGDYAKIKIDSNLKVLGLSRGDFSIEKSFNNSPAFTGYLYIKEPSKYKKYLLEFKSIKKEIYFPIKNYIKSGSNIFAKELIWTDCGTFGKYKKYLNKKVKYDFSKSKETLLIFKNKSVYKIFQDKEIAINRLKKSNLYNKALPQCKELPSGYGYSYKFREGKTLYEYKGKEVLSLLLKFLSEKLWRDKIYNNNLKKNALRFYKDKTNSRIDLLNNKYDLYNIKSINGISLQSGIIPDFDYKKLVDNAIFCPIHGDLQYDNIIIDKDYNFTLIDWRHEFGGSVEYGDLYYDLAKLLGGIIINYKRIKENQFECSLDNKTKDIKYSYELDDYVKVHLKILRDFHQSNNLDFDNTKKLMSLVFLNMSPLHEPPFDLFLLALAYNYYHKDV